MPQNALDVVNQAISKAGGEKIGAFDENTPLAVLAAEDYPPKRALMLSRHRWVFAKTIVQLGQIAAPADCPRTFAYQRPAGLIGQIHDYRAAARDDAVKVSCLQVADYIASDAQPVWVEYTRDVDEAHWPPWFTELVATAFAVEVANAKQRRAKAQDLHVEAFGNPEDHGEGGLMGQAKQADSANAPKRTLEWENGGALVEARFSGGAFGLNDGRLGAAVLRGMGG